MIGEVGIVCDTTSSKAVSDLLMAMTPRIRAAERRAINNTASGIRTDLVAAIRVDFFIKASDIRDAIKIDKATGDHLLARLHGSGKPGIPLFDFSHTPARVPSTIRTKGGGYSPQVGLSISVSRARGASIMPGTFAARMSSGHVGIFIRTGAKTSTGKPQIAEKFGPSVEKLISGRRYKDLIKQSVDERIEKNLAHELHYVMEVEK